MDNKEQILARLSRADKNQIKLAIKFGYPPTQTNNNGQIKLSQWKSWQVLQKYGLALIKSDDDTYKLELTELGKEIGELL